jgi:isopenicillin-N epimerase
MNWPGYSPLKKFWCLDEEVVFLNHGSFGACPLPVLQKQDEWRLRMERQPVRFMVRELEQNLWEAKTALGKFVGAQPENLAFVNNATLGVNTILNSMPWNEGDEVLTTNHGYGACLNALHWFAGRNKACVTVAEIPFPILSPQQVTQAIMDQVTSRTRLVMIDYITSPTGLLFPVKELVSRLGERGIDCLIDGAHAPGQIPLQLDDLNAAYFTGNCHKWICSPKGSAFIYVRKDKQPLIRPLSVSHTYDRPVEEGRQWSSQFFWPGTSDYSAFLCVKEAIEWMGNLFPGGWPELMHHNRRLCLDARKMVAEKTGIALAAPEEMIANLSSFDLGVTSMPAFGFNFISPLWNRLYDEYKIELPVLPWRKENPRLLLRFSTQCYNSMEQYEYLAAALNILLR